MSSAAKLEREVAHPNHSHLVTVLLTEQRHRAPAQCFIDPELGSEGVTYVLESGAEGSVLSDHVLEINRDPAYMRDLLLYRLTVEAVKRMESSPSGVRQVSRRLKTSPAQVYRLLDTTNYKKTIDKMLELLQVLDAKVDIRVV